MRNPFCRKEPAQLMVIARPDWLEIICDEDVIRIPYGDIIRVEVYKTDDLTVDTIWLQVDTSGRSYFVNDYYAGFPDAVDDLAKHLSGFRRDWFVPVTAETFKENRTVLYDAGNR